jgi:hypothetical protein
MIVAECADHSRAFAPLINSAVWDKLTLAVRTGVMLLETIGEGQIPYIRFKIICRN